MSRTERVTFVTHHEGRCGCLGNNSNKRRSRLADMSMVPAERSYIPTPVPPADELTYVIEPDSENQLVVRLRTYRKRTVDFAVMHRTFEGGQWVDVARIDCCGGRSTGTWRRAKASSYWTTT
jgi:hypothetical protein